MNIPLEQPWFLLLIPLGMIAVWKLVRQRGGIGYSTVSLLKGLRVGTSLLIIERLLILIFIVASALILASPTQVVKESVPIYKDARDIVLVLDLSGSMFESSSMKIKTARSVISDFVQGRPQDRIAFFAFENKAYLEWPLSTDHETLIARVNNVTGGGGTTISSGVIAGLEHQAQYGQGSGAVIIVSDGVSEVKPKEKEAIEDSIGTTMLYWIWIGDKDAAHALEFKAYVESLGGKVFQGEAEDLDEIFNEISQLEASPVIWEQHTNTVYNYGALPAIAFFALLGAGLVDLMREV